MVSVTTGKAAVLAAPALLALVWAGQPATGQATGQPATGRAAAGPGVCAGVGGCRVVAHVDVNGDGTRDPVGLARRGADGAEHGRVLLRVRVRADRIVSVRQPLEWWYGDPWQGAATLDGRRGKELVVGRVTGAHTLNFRSWTWRHGTLVPLHAPGRDALWQVDSAATGVVGWLRRDGDPRGEIRRRVADRDHHGDLHGRVVTFRWTREGWQRTHLRRVDHVTLRMAERWAGWHVPGLDRW